MCYCQNVPIVICIFIVQLTVMHLCEKQQNNWCASPFRLSTHLQIPFVCQLASLGQFKTSADILYALTSATLSATTTDFPERNMFCTKPAKKHAKDWHVQCLFSISKGRLAWIYLNNCLRNELSNVYMLNYQLYLPGSYHTSPK